MEKVEKNMEKMWRENSSCLAPRVRGTLALASKANKERGLR